MFCIRLCLVVFLSILTMHVWADETVRQRRTVIVNGELEEWTLKWSGPVRPVCSASDLTQAVTCPCSGFAYGEQGHLSLDRKRNGALVESMELSSLFGDFDNLADKGNAVLVRIPRDRNDPFDDIGDTNMLRKFKTELSKRSPADVIDPRDFLQDGTKASFLLQVGNAPCGKQETILVGVSRRSPNLHVFSTAAHPERPLVLQRGAWMAVLATAGQATFTELACGDHGSENEVEQIIQAHDGVLSVKANTYACERDGARGALLESEEE
jgi:hypothetical protein